MSYERISPAQYTFSVNVASILTKKHTESRPSCCEAMSLLGVAWRVKQYIGQEFRDERLPIFDLKGPLLKGSNPGPFGGVPCGGLGSGSIGIGSDGAFRRWNLHPGKYVHNAIHANAFHLYIRRGKHVQVRTLSIYKQAMLCCGMDKSSPHSPHHMLPLLPESVTYHGLHPFAWTVYEEPVPAVRVTLRQFSPFLPGEYADASLPTTLFDVCVENMSDTQAIDEMSVMFTYKNGSGDAVESNSRAASVHVPDTACTARFAPFSIPVARSSDADSSVDPSSGAQTQSAAGKDTRYREVASSPASAATGVCVHGFRHTVAQNGVHSDPYSLSIAALATADVEVTMQPAFQTTSNSHQQPQACACVRTCSHKLSRGFLRTCRSFVGLVAWSWRRCCGSKGGRGAHKGKLGGSSTLDTALVCSSDNNDRGELSNVTAIEEVTSKAAGIDPAAAVAQAEPAVLNTHDIYQQFRETGALCTLHDLASRHTGGGGSLYPYQLTSAVCARVSAGVAPLAAATVSFTLSWDNPVARFPGSGVQMPRYYTRFFGKSGCCADVLAAYSVHKARSWMQEVREWQAQVMEDVDAFRRQQQHQQQEQHGGEDEKSMPSATDAHMSLQSPRASPSPSEPSYYMHQLFNELYYLSDGGSLWLDSSDGEANIEAEAEEQGKQGGVAGEFEFGGMLGRLGGRRDGRGGDLALEPADLLQQLSAEMHAHSHRVRCAASAGDQSLVGQWLYFEGHEYLMFNTSDVHFYAGAALRSLWPHLELSIQKDYAVAVLRSDRQMRPMLSCGTLAQRKVAGTVPHDLGSPSGVPFRLLNAYNFQDVSEWRDLSSKFSLQVYAAYLSVADGNTECDGGNGSSAASTSAAKKFLQQVFPAVLIAMRGALSFIPSDKEHNALIHNGPNPDQTYDIWPCKGASAYTGGLWVAAAQATAAMAGILSQPAENETYSKIAARAQHQYVRALWNGSYVNFDCNSNALHADMLAGHAWSRHLGLPGVLSATQALSCCNMLYKFNVQSFSKLAAAARGEHGQRGMCGSGWCLSDEPPMWGAINGMMPDGSMDETCLQSREVWTGATYALAAAMLVEATAPAPASAYVHAHAMSNSINGGISTTAASAAEGPEARSNLVHMAFSTAQGVHDAGWRRLGYHFATPESWDCTGSYRALAYMRPLAIWQMQTAIAKAVREATAATGAGDDAKRKREEGRGAGAGAGAGAGEERGSEV